LSTLICEALKNFARRRVQTRFKSERWRFVKMSKKKSPLSDNLTHPSTDDPMESSESNDPMTQKLIDQLEAFGSSTTTVNEEQTLPQTKFLPPTPTQCGVAKKPTVPKEAMPKETVQKEAQQKAVSRKSVPKKAQRKEAARKVAMTTSNVGQLSATNAELPTSAVSHQVSSRTFFLRHLRHGQIS
jgi:hypothetical protein